MLELPKAFENLRRAGEGREVVLEPGLRALVYCKGARSLKCVEAETRGATWSGNLAKGELRRAGEDIRRDGCELAARYSASCRMHAQGL